MTIRAPNLGNRLLRICNARAKVPDPTTDFIVIDDAKGENPRLSHWDEGKLGTTPTQQEVDAAGDTYEPPITDGDIDILEKAFKVFGLLIAQYTGKTPAQVKSDFKTIWKSIK